MVPLPLPLPLLLLPLIQKHEEGELPCHLCHYQHWRYWRWTQQRSLFSVPVLVPVPAAVQTLLVRALGVTRTQEE